MKTLAELAGQWEIRRWARAMREVVADIRADAKRHRAESAQATRAEPVVALRARAEECERIAEVLSNAIDREEAGE